MFADNVSSVAADTQRLTHQLISNCKDAKVHMGLHWIYTGSKCMRFSKSTGLIQCYDPVVEFNMSASVVKSSISTM